MLNVVVAVDPADPETSAPGGTHRRTGAARLDRNALRGKRIGFIPATWWIPSGDEHDRRGKGRAAVFHGRRCDDRRNGR